MDLQPPNAQAVADFCRLVLSNVLDELVYEVPDETSNTEKVKQSLRNISNLYKNGLRFASSKHRSSWDDPANRCAYVFLYLMQHCYLVHCSLQNSDDVSRSWRNRNNLKVCSIGGGPGSDLVGLTTFLRENSIFPPSLECLVLDLYPNWKLAWDKIYEYVPERFSVNYSKCDLVMDKRLSTKNLQFVKQADILTLSKSFSAVSAFFRNDPGKGNFLRSILREIKPGCFVLYIDNDFVGCTQFKEEFASRVGLDLMFEFRGKPTLPSGPYSHTIRKYCRLFDFSPMRSCSVIIQLFRKKGSAQTGPAAKYEKVSSIRPYRPIIHDVVSSCNHGVSTIQTTTRNQARYELSSARTSFNFPTDTSKSQPHRISSNLTQTTQHPSKSSSDTDDTEPTSAIISPSRNPPVTRPSTRKPHQASLHTSSRLPSTSQHWARDGTEGYRGDDKTARGCCQACSIL